ncbi:hypothetical protein FNJ87_15340 [Nonlabens mediterrranea]|uniref:IPTL-CTERM protein sorting domain-containing protein n=1 Tax=Nonlabens mediterrranea TaxID=1419947 RepID=A0ABS0A8D1_9FLAO|nr:hypothetical protein [Nonlabens mediterrranea]
MSNILSLSLTVLVQQATPPVPKMGIPPPVGDVPLDTNLWVLLASALFIGAVVVYRSRKRVL